MQKVESSNYIVIGSYYASTDQAPMQTKLSFSTICLQKIQTSFTKIITVSSPKSQLILQPFRRFAYVTANSATVSFLHLRHSSFTNPSFASPTSQAIHLRHLASRPWHKHKHTHTEAHFKSLHFCDSANFEFFLLWIHFQIHVISLSECLMPNSNHLKIHCFRFLYVHKAIFE